MPPTSPSHASPCSLHRAGWGIAGWATGSAGDPTTWTLSATGIADWEAITRSDAFQAGLSELDGLLEAATVALLCAEVNPMSCHRTGLIAPVLETRGHRVRHILGDGQAVDHQPALDLEG